MPNERKTSNLPLVDGLEGLARPTLGDYVAAASEYVLRCREEEVNGKAAQLRLSDSLATILKCDLLERLSPELVGEVVSGERTVAGGLRYVQADVSEFTEPDGLRLAVELKPVNLAVGRAIWNRFGDIRAFSVNIHLKFPFAVVGGVIALPIWEEKEGTRTSTMHLIERLVIRLDHAGGRRSDGDAAHLLEGVGVIAYDPDTAKIVDDLPQQGSGLRWTEFVDSLVDAYEGRFGY